MSTNRIIPSNQAILKEATELSEEILRNIELSEIALGDIALKASRLARLLNDDKMRQVMQYEAGGYPTAGSGIPSDIWELAVAAGRTFEKEIKGEMKNKAYRNSIADLELSVASLESGLSAAADVPSSVQSANPRQTLFPSSGNQMERYSLRSNASLAANRLAARRQFIYDFAMRVNLELKFSGIADDIFSRVRERVDAIIGTTIPESVRKLTSVHDNLQSDNPEDWSNAVHTCRRLLKDLADAVFPPTEDRVVDTGSAKKTIRLGPDSWVNRLVAFVESHSDSERFQEIVGSHLDYLGNRLDGVANAASKGTHTDIVDKAEADRYVIFTYLLVADILSLNSEG